jgi:hypothetical protein
MREDIFITVVILGAILGIGAAINLSFYICWSNIIEPLRERISRFRGGLK